MVNSKFNSVFSKKNTKTMKAPIALRKTLNLEAPKGYSYELMEGTKDMYVLRSNEHRKENSFQVRIRFPLKFEGMEIHNINELIEAMYRTQKVFKLDQSLQNDPPTIIHLGSSGVTDQIIGSVKRFPDLEPLEIEVDKQKVYLPIKRVAYPSLTEIKIVSDRNHLIDLELILNEKSGDANLVMKLNYDNLVTLDDYFKNLDVIRSFFKGGIKIFNKFIEPDKKQVEVFEKNHDFLEALKQIQNYFAVSFDFPQKIDNDDVYFTKILFESFINERLVAIKNKSQISFSFDKKKFNPSEHTLEQGATLGVVSPRELTLQMFGVELHFCEYRIYPQMIFKKIVDNKQDEIQVVFKLPEESSHYILYSSDSVEDFDMSTDGQELFKLTDTAVNIEKVDFTKLHGN
ncbi:abortive infection system toxin AbiGii family protein [Streptococcus mutans]|uniref:abortive infection system toxin AbiGii family protein n=1 Tax=Streptococcus mutans TaxID=1309 RepID=UPI00274180C5|nr:abortive infection system toxin AbiGii family protein [Streptococcus mutans]MDP5873904.1 abortive infection system toxin AbiGii family protein [Streptococcus mutans]